MTEFLDKQGLQTLWGKIKAEDAKRIAASEKGVKNGVATLDANGRIPVEQLANLDTTFAEVVSALPTTGIKKHLYLIKSDESTTKNIYKEYVYTGDVDATYDESKWEELGEYRSEVDLSSYSKKTETVASFGTPTATTTNVSIPYTKADGTAGTAILIPTATTTTAGLMSKDDKVKLNGLSNYTHPASEAGAKASGLYKITTDANGHVIAAVEVTKEDLTALGLQDASEVISDDFINALA